MEDQVYPEEKLSDIAENSSKRNTKRVSTKDVPSINVASEVCQIKRTKKGVEQGPIEHGTVDIKDEQQRKDQELLVESNVVGGAFSLPCC